MKKSSINSARKAQINSFSFILYMSEPFGPAVFESFFKAMILAFRANREASLNGTFFRILAYYGMDCVR